MSDEPDLDEMPLAECEMCLQSAEHYASLHGCQDMLFCGDHWFAWLYAITARVKQEGWVACEHCNAVFDDVRKIVKARVI